MHTARTRIPGHRNYLAMTLVMIAASGGLPALAGTQADLPALKDQQLDGALNQSRPDHRVVLETVGGSSGFILRAAGHIEAAEGRLLGFELSRADGLTIENGTASGRLEGGAMGLEVFGPIRELILSQPARIRVHVDTERVENGADHAGGNADDDRRLSSIDMQIEPQAAELAPRRDGNASRAAAWRFVPDGKIAVTERAGTGDTQSTQRLEFGDRPLNGITMAEIGDRPCFLALSAGGEDGDAQSPYIDCEYGDFESKDLVRSARHLGRVLAGIASSRNRSRLNRRDARLPADHAVVAIEVCLNNTRPNARVKGIELRGWRPLEYLDAELDRAELMATDSFARPNCRKREFVSCPRRTLATGVIATLRIRGEKRGWINGLRLLCRPIEQH